MRERVKAQSLHQRAFAFFRLSVAADRRADEHERKAQAIERRDAKARAEEPRIRFHEDEPR
ncbi:hypothetical protein SAMN05519104_6690 [Rhizobiales bacterium GAS188]|nr:hypothetical protein SAMN05519104_6690 [Rhizobiales bacterium GAS188]